MQEKLFQRRRHLLYCSVLSLGGNVNTPRSVEAWHGIHLSHKKSMKYSGHRKLLCELSKPSKFNAFNLLGYWTNTDASILVYKFRPERPGFNMYAEYTHLQLTFLALWPWSKFKTLFESNVLCFYKLECSFLSFLFEYFKIAKWTNFSANLHAQEVFFPWSEF